MLKSERAQRGLEKLWVARREVLGLQCEGGEEEETGRHLRGKKILPSSLARSLLAEQGSTLSICSLLRLAAGVPDMPFIWTLQPFLLHSSWPWAKRRSGWISNCSGQGAIPAVVARS